MINFNRKLLTVFSLAVFAISPAVFISNTYASEHHGHDDHDGEQAHEEEQKGPMGGKLLAKGDNAIEVTIFESGIAPEMRIYAYHDGERLPPEAFSIDVTLNRLGGVQDQISFTAEADYQLGQQTIVEPHSYDVIINARINGESLQWQYENHEGRAEISERLITLSGIETHIADSQILTQTDTLFGVISPVQDSVFNVYAPYSSIVKKVWVQVGEMVEKNQPLVQLQNTETLQTYTLKSPANGEVSARFINRGDRVFESPLIEVSDLSQVWVDLSAFPENIERLKVGQTVKVYDLHAHEQSFGKISYIAPQMTGGHIARARATINNTEGHWRPGMHIKADIELSQRKTNLAVKASALQSFREMPVVFARYGNTFEVRMIEIGERNEDWIEVLSGLAAGTEYVSGNSFVLKADVLKDGASHDH